MVFHLSFYLQKLCASSLHYMALQSENWCCGYLKHPLSSSTIECVRCHATKNKIKNYATD